MSMAGAINCQKNQLRNLNVLRLIFYEISPAGGSLMGMYWFPWRKGKNVSLVIFPLLP